MACRLIINVDDYGLTEGVNEAVSRLHDEGVVTSTSLMVAGPALGHGLGLLEARPGLAVGLHVALVAAPALLPRHAVPRITDERGWLSGRHASAGFRYTCHPGCRGEMRAELAAQFAAFERLGIPWSHVDSHRHFHLTPAVFGPMQEEARRRRVPGFRVPEDDWELYHRLDPEDARRQRGLARTFAFLCAGQRRALKRSGFKTARWCYGLFRTLRLDGDYLRRLVLEMPDGDFELHCHPDLSTERGRREYAALADRGFRSALEERGVRLIRYADLA